MKSAAPGQSLPSLASASFQSSEGQRGRPDRRSCVSVENSPGGSGASTSSCSSRSRSESRPSTCRMGDDTCDVASRQKARIGPRSSAGRDDFGHWSCCTPAPAAPAASDGATRMATLPLAAPRSEATKSAWSKSAMATVW
eukprot:scaffold11806_cov95-Isochrysis_galbana.AAC.3